MKKALLYIIFLLNIFSALKAQPGWNLKENSQWKFFLYSGLDFRKGSAIADTSALGAFQWNFYYNGESENKNPMGSSPASVSDIQGNLLFYAGAANIYDRNHHVMPNGTDIWGSYPNMFRNSVIVPSLTDFNQYYLFYISGGVGLPAFGTGMASPNDFRLRYSLIDMRLNNGLGDVVNGQKNIAVAEDLSGMLTAAAGNDCNIWIITHARDSAQFKAFEFTAAGINTNPVISNSGVLQPFPGLAQLSFTCMMEVSPNRKRLGMTTQLGIVPAYNLDYTATTELFDFDANTGIINNALVVDTPSWFLEWGMGISGLCFSPDNSKLYATSYTTDAPFRHLAQFDLNLGSGAAIMKSRTIMIDSLKSYFSTPRLGQDGKIYILTEAGNDAYDKSYLGCVNNPNQVGSGANPRRLAVSLRTNTGSVNAGDLGSGFIQPQAGDSIYTRHDTILCSYMDSLILRPTYPSYHYQWNNGSSDSIKVVAFPGTYWVTNSDYCHYRVDTFVVKYVNMDFEPFRDTVVCNEASFTIVAPIDDAQYLWQDSSASPYFTANSSGTYWVGVEKESCIINDTIQVTLHDLRQNLGNDTVYCKGDPIQLRLDANVSAGAKVTWNVGSTDSFLTITQPGDYSVHVAIAPCEGSDSIQIAIDPFCECSLNIPNAFSPNGDGLNDIFLPVTEVGCPVRNYTLSIYNRYGQRIYNSNDSDKGWDGWQNGQPASLGSYMFEVKFEGGTKGKTYYVKGDITLLR